MTTRRRGVQLLRELTPDEQKVRGLLILLMKAMSCTATIYGDEKHLIRLGDVNLENATINVACGTITIGNGTFCGSNVSILTGSHDLTGTRERSPWGRHIVIGEYVWLGSNCTILGPCTIGDRCVIAAGAVVTKDCEEGWIYGGVPAKKIRRAED